ncbi:MAG: Rieske 2Fe-2S domain-containing protein [Myxococcota bacterium]
MTSRSGLLRYFHPVMSVRALGAKPERILLGGERYVLWRDGRGVPRALADACPHRAAPLSLGRVGADGRLACRYHGWSFDGEGGGQCPSQPGLKVQTTAYQVVEAYGYLWLAERDVPRASLPVLEWDGYVLAGAFPTAMQAPLHIMLDNFTEDEHFPYVHQAFGWAPEDWPQVRFEATLHDDHTEACYAGPQRPSPLVTALGVRRGDWFHNRFVSRFDPVHSVYTSHWEDPASGETRPIMAKTAVFMLPEDDKTTRFHTFLFLKIDPTSAFRFARPLIEKIALGFVRLEWWMDGRWTRHLADTVPDLKGQRLGKFDKTVIRNRKLLDSIYFGVRPDLAARRSADGA